MEDKKEFDVLFKTYYSRLYCYAFHIINDLEASKDITSDAFEYLWLHFSEIKATTAKSYLYAYAHSKSIDYLRKLCIHKEYTKYVELTADDVDNHFCEFDERIMMIRKVMDKLPVNTRHILEECYIRRKMYKEVAEELDISVNTVKKHIVKALRLIRLEMSEKRDLWDS